jgi:flavin reductase (NADH)
MFVEVTQIIVRADGDGLIYFDRNFHRLARAIDAPQCAASD